MSGEEWEIVYYTLPVERVEPGMSTDDAQDVTCVSVWPDDTAWFLDVYTPADDEDRDRENRSAGECRGYEPGERVGLAVYVDTEVDGSMYPDAVVRTPKQARDAPVGW